MKEAAKKAILVVSFGTSYEETRRRTIEKIEADIQHAYPDYRIYRAFTSQMIIRKLKQRDGIRINTVKEAMEELLRDGITDLSVQPTHIINGIENDQMTADVKAYEDQLEHLCFGNPLLTTSTDQQDLINAVMPEFADLDPDTDALVLMGHGTSHHANAVYAALDYRCKDEGYRHVFIGTVEAYPAPDTLIRQIRRQDIKRIVLAPLLIVAGDHAVNDLAGDDPDSWKSIFTAAGFEVSCRLRGIGEYPGVRRMFLAHLAAAMEQSASV